jgi:hypothetical protein
MGAGLLLACLVGAGVDRAVAAPKAVDIRPALGKGFPEYEKVLGKPVKTEKSPNGEGEVRSYKVGGFTHIDLTQPGADGVTQALFGFPKDTVKSWKQAFAQLSLPTKGVTLKRGEDYYWVQGLPNGWEAAWAPNNPDTGSHTLFIYPKGL